MNTPYNCTNSKLLQFWRCIRGDARTLSQTSVTYSEAMLNSLECALNGGVVTVFLVQQQVGVESLLIGGVGEVTTR